MSAELDALLAVRRTEFHAVVKEALQLRVEQLKSEVHDLSGVAVNVGVPYELKYGLALCWTREAELEEPSPYYRYNVEEWDHWEDAPLAKATPLIEAWNDRFDAIHEEDEQNFELDEHELLHLQRFHEALFDAMADLAAQGLFRLNGRRIYAVLWFTQAEHDLVGESVAAFNSPEVVAAYQSEFG